MWRVATRGGGIGEGDFFLQPEVRRRRPRRGVCAMRFLQAALLSSARCICTAAGWFLGPAGARAIAFCRILVASLVRLQSGRIERRGLDREARGHQADGALQGERYRGALHGCNVAAATLDARQ